MDKIYSRNANNKNILFKLCEDFIVLNSSEKKKYKEDEMGFNQSKSSKFNNDKDCNESSNNNDSNSTRPTTGKTQNLEEKLNKMTTMRNLIKYKDDKDTGSILNKIIIPKHLYRAVQNKETSKLFKT